MIKPGNLKGRLAQTTLAAGLGLIGLSQTTNSTPQAAAGVALVAVGGSAYALQRIERAIKDTSRERAQLLQDQRAAQQFHQRYVAARALLDKEAEHLCSQIADIERETAERIETEHEELMADVESRESQLKQQGWWLGYDAGRRGILAGPMHSADGATIIPMPKRAIGSDDATAGRSSKS